MGTNHEHYDGGIASFYEERANGLNTATMHAPAALAGSYDIELLDALPGGPELLRIDAAGKLTTVSSAAAGSLDTAYDFGGPGAGRVILTTDGPVELAGVDGLRLNTTIPKIEFETDVGDFNYRIAASATANKLLFQRGDQDADISDDVFVTILSIDELRMVGINTANPQEALHVTVASDIDAKARIQSPVGRDASIPFFEDSTSRFEIGYDDSAGGFVLGRVDFTNPVLFVEDVTGDVGIGELDPDAKVHVTDAAAIVAIFESGAASGGISLIDSTTTDENEVRLIALGDDFEIIAGAAVVAHFDAAIGSIGFGTGAASSVLGKYAFQNDTNTVRCVFIDQNATDAPALRIDGEATNSVLIDLNALITNQEGDIEFTPRSVEASLALSGQMWFNNSTDRFRCSWGGAVFATMASRYGTSFGPVVDLQISAGVAGPVVRGHLRIESETGTSDILSTLSVSGTNAPQDGDTIVIRALGTHTINVQNNGNIRLDGGATAILNSVNDTRVLMWAATTSQWIEVSGSNNTA